MPLLEPITDEEMGLAPPPGRPATAVATAGFIVLFYTWAPMLRPRLWERLYLAMDEAEAIAYCGQYIHDRHYVFGCELYRLDNLADAVLVCDTRKGVIAADRMLPAVAAVEL